MAYNEELTAAVRAALADEPDVEEKRMFGGVGFMVNGKLCIGAGDHADHQLLVRVGPAAYEAALQRPGAAPAIMRGREMTGYVFVTADGLRGPADFESWAELALTYNGALTGRPPTRRDAVAAGPRPARSRLRS